MNELLEKVKNKYARQVGYANWQHLLNNDGIIETRMDHVAIRFAKAVAERSLENASENVQMKEVDFNSPIPRFKGKAHQIDKESITNPKNIPL